MNETAVQLAHYCSWLKDDAERLTKLHKWFYGEVNDIFYDLLKEDDELKEGATETEKAIHDRLDKILNSRRIEDAWSLLCRH